jgi:hypothetical protein
MDGIDASVLTKVHTLFKCPYFLPKALALCGFGVALQISHFRELPCILRIF